MRNSHTEKTAGRTGIQSFFFPASFTVEASLLMAVILPVLTALLILGFYLHDQACLQGEACEISSLAGNWLEYDEREDMLQAAVSSARSASLTWTGSKQVEADADDDHAFVVCSGSFAVPGFVLPLFMKHDLPAQKEWKRYFYRGADLIRKVRGAKKLWDTLKS